uniref:Phospholipid/glycerol acyltransferase domain-containing protein n=1 Tax=Plectus sambesii TaxID=2011161 RepID=A0A914VJ48_9BILA
MLDWLLVLVRCYAAIILGPVIATTILIICGAGWGPLPHLYVWLLKKALSLSPETYPQPEEEVTNWWPSIIERSERGKLQRHRHGSGASFAFTNVKGVEKTATSDLTFSLTSSAFAAGIEAIVQDELSCCFYPAPVQRWNWLTRPWFALSHAQTAGYLLSCAFRYSVLVPIRVALLVISFMFVGVCSFIPIFYTLNKNQRAYIGVTYCRLFCAGLGLVATYHDFDINRPRKGGICMSNHMTPNDIQIIFANVLSEADKSSTEATTYTVTGQSHTGIIWYIEQTTAKLCSALWFDRADMRNRVEFMNIVLKYTQSSEMDPVLLFPEGYCTNNTRALQFRKALFECSNAPIYPIALKQDASLGDSFWGDDPFWVYLVKVISSWAIIYDVYHLPKMVKGEDESATSFAGRVQHAICEAARIEPLAFDGFLFHKEPERNRYRTQQQWNNAQVFLRVLQSQPDLDELLAD